MNVNVIKSAAKAAAAVFGTLALGALLGKGFIWWAHRGDAPEAIKVNENEGGGCSQFANDFGETKHNEKY